MKLKRVGILSVGKTAGLLYTILGLFIGLIYGAFAGVMLGAMLPMMSEMAASSGDPALSDAFGGGAPAISAGAIALGAIIVFPILYGLIGFLGGMLSAAVYNFAAKLTGGYELHFESNKEADAFSTAKSTIVDAAV